MNHLLRSTSLVVLAAIAGCGGPVDAIVSGNVTIDGQPLKQGEIIFEATDGATIPGSAEIKDGQYQLMVAPGKKVVRINASRPNGIVDPLMKTEGSEPMIPAEFNTQSKLTANVKAGKQAGMDFQVTEIPKK